LKPAAFGDGSAASALPAKKPINIIMAAVANNVHGFCAIVYVSTARVATVSALQSAATSLSSSPLVGARLAHCFRDPVYERTSFCLLSTRPDRVQRSAIALCAAANRLVDFREYRGTHPALGAIDHICVSPLPHLLQADHQNDVDDDDDGDDETGKAAAAALGISIGRHLTAELGVHCEFYGACHSDRPALQSVRRRFGYFSQTATKTGALASSPASLPPGVDESATDAATRARSGICCIGATSLVAGLNFRLRPSAPRAQVVQLARRMRVASRVESLTLTHADGALEVACNLLRPHRTRWAPAAQRERAAALALELGLHVDEAYTTGLALQDMHDVLRDEEAATVCV
jgi:hypothetical protein